MLEWDDKYRTGIAKIDEQHKTLFQMLNKFEEDIHDGKAESAFRATLVFLSGYVKNHFGYEEECMAERNCPFALQNLQAHQKFIEAFRMFEDRLGNEGFSWELLRELHTSVEEWLTNHICKVDIKLREITTADV